MFNKLLGKWMFCSKEIEFTLDETGREAYTMSKFLEVSPTYAMSVAQVHTFTKQSLIEGKDPRLIKM